MEALGLKAQSGIQTYDGMRRLDMVCCTKSLFVSDLRRAVGGPATYLLCSCLQAPKA